MDTQTFLKMVQIRNVKESNVHNQIEGLCSNRTISV